MPKASPPHQDVGRIEVLVGEAGLGIGEPGPRDGDTWLAPELIGERTVDVVRIDRVRGRALAPDPDPQGPLLRWVLTAPGLARKEQPEGRQGRGRIAYERSTCMEALLDIDINHCVAVSVGINSRGRSCWWWVGPSFRIGGQLVTNICILHQAG